MYGSLGSLGSLGTRVYASLVTMCIKGRVTFKINGYFVLVARRCCLLKHGVRSVPTGPIRMPTMEGSAEEGQPSGRREDRITQLKPPASLDFYAINLADSWKRWRQEVELYMDLAMKESMKVKLFLYLLWSRGREIYSTMTFEAPVHERNLKQVMDAFDRHCNPKKNETVERYKFFSRFQNPRESLENFITDLKLLATTCNFGVLKDSLVRDRIICGIQDKQLREDLLKDPYLDLQRCLDACRAAELSKQ